MNRYDNEKVIFGHGVTTVNLTDPQRDFILFFERELGEIIKKQSNIKVLDIGCGAGNKTKALKIKYPFLNLTGCDISKSAIKEANINSKNIKYIVENATKLTFKNSEFDVCLMNSVLDHTNNPQKAIYEVSRVLKKGGIYLFTSPLEADLCTIHGLFTKYIKSFRKFRQRRLGHNFAFSRKTLFKMINKSFKVKETQFAWFYFAQIIDIVYYPILILLNKNPDESIDNYIVNNKSLVSFFLKMVRNVFTVVQNVESSMFNNFLPGFFVYVKAVKK